MGRMRTCRTPPTRSDSTRHPCSAPHRARRGPWRSLDSGANSARAGARTGRSAVPRAAFRAGAGSCLAAPAERGLPAVDGVCGTERRAAATARFAGAVVHLELELKAALLARAGAVVPHRRALGANGRFEYLADGPIE